MVYLTVTQVLFLHARLIAETGGEQGVRDVGLLESAVARPQATFAGEDLYPTLFAKAAALMFSLVQNHPFVDGNKRTGITATALFLRLNQRQLMVTNEEMVSFVMRVTEQKPPLEEIATWLEKGSVEIS